MSSGNILLAESHTNRYTPICMEGAESELDEGRKNLLALVESHDTNLKAVSLAIGKNHSYLQQYIKRFQPKKLDDDTRAKLGEHFGVVPDIFRANPPERVDASSVRHSRPPGAIPISLTDWPRNLPVYGTAEGGDGTSDFSFNGQTIDMVRRPPALMGVPDAFAIYVQGDSMSPWAEHGDLVCINPHRPVRVKDYVVVEMFGDNGAEGTACLLKRLVRRSGKKLTVEQFNPPGELQLDARKVRNLWRVLTASEMVEL